MGKYIIKLNGTMSEIIAALKTLQAITGNGAPVSDVAIAVNGLKFTKTLKNQINKEV